MYSVTTAAWRQRAFSLSLSRKCPKKPPVGYAHHGRTWQIESVQRHDLGAPFGSARKDFPLRKRLTPDPSMQSLRFRLAALHLDFVRPSLETHALFLSLPDLNHLDPRGQL
jgi:hypothetical protein